MPGEAIGVFCRTVDLAGGAVFGALAGGEFVAEFRPDLSGEFLQAGNDFRMARGEVGFFAGVGVEVVELMVADAGVDVFAGLADAAARASQRLVLTGEFELPLAAAQSFKVVFVVVEIQSFMRRLGALAGDHGADVEDL